MYVGFSWLNVLEANTMNFVPALSQTLACGLLLVEYYRDLKVK
jgi:hypothetical protein